MIDCGKISQFATFSPRSYLIRLPFYHIIKLLITFKKKLQIIESKTSFEAIDGLHEAVILDDVVSLKMADVSKVENYEDYLFLDTGSPHHITYVDDVNNVNVKISGSKIRYGAPYFTEGSNVNFVQQISDSTFKVRTYERGVENETLACGTGVTASAIGAYIRFKIINLIINTPTVILNYS